MRIEIHRFRRFIQAIFLILFIGLLVLATRRTLTEFPVEFFLISDPLVVLTALIHNPHFQLKFLFALITVAVTLGLGRVFCGYVCPLGTLLDIGSPLSRIFKLKRGTFSKLKSAPVIMLVFVLVTTILGVNILMVLDPIVLLSRTFSVTVFPAINHGLTKSSDSLYGYWGLSKYIDLFNYKLAGILIFSGRRAFVGVLWISLLFIIVLGLNLLGRRFWCRYLCPLGGLLGLLSRVPLWRRSVDTTTCTNCLKCVRSCEMEAISGRGVQTDAAICTLCLKCKDICPEDAISVSAETELTAEMPSRRAALATIGLSAAAVYAIPYKDWPKPDRTRMIRPPGALVEETFLDQCIRCGECLKVCPSNVLQPALLQYGLDAIWTPHLDFNISACEMECNACGRVCPTGAIHALKLADKKRFVIGLAKLDRQRCIAWETDRGCSVCQELCPVAEKAVVFRQTKGKSGRVLQRPYVVKERCIGCGVCEIKCPVKGRKAIRVFRS